MITAIDIASWVSLLAGSFFVLTGGIGVLRLPDFFTRMHATGITDTMGTALLLLGLMLQAGFSAVTIKLILILAFVFITSPTATHALAKAARHSDLKPLLGEAASLWRT